MDAATLNVVINATDSASAVLQRVAGNVRALGSTTAGATALTEEMNRQIAASSGVGSKTAMQIQRYASSMNATKDSIKALNRGLKDQQAVTQSGKAILEQHTKALDSKKAAVAAASQAYAQNTQAARANIAQLKGEQALIAATKNQRQNELTMLRETSKTLNTNTQEYKDNQQAIKWTQAELKDADARYKSVTNAIAEQERVIAGNKTAFQGAKAEMRQAVQDHAAMQSAVDASTASEEAYRQEIQRMEREYRRTGQQMLDRGQDLRQLGEGIDAVTKPIQIAGAAAGVGLGIASKAAIDFEDSFAAVQKTVDGTPEQLDAIKQSIIDMATAGINGHKAIPLTTNDLTELAAAGGQLGILTGTIVDYTETMAMLGTATNLYGEQGAATIARFMNVTNTAQGEVSNLGSAIVDLGNHYATTEAEIAEMALRMGSTGTVVGISAQDILAYSTVLSSMGTEAQAGGSAVSRIWMDIQSAVSSGGDDLKAFAKLSGKSSEDFAQQWKTDASGAFKDFLQGLSQSKDKVKELEELGFANINDIRALQNLASAKGMELLTDALKRANTAWHDNTALQDEFEKKAETTASKISVLKNNATEAARSFGEVMLPSLVDITGGLTGAAQSMAGWSDGTKKAAVNTALFLAGTGAAAKGTASLIKGAGGVMDGIGKIKAFAAASEGGGAALAAMGSAALPVAVGVAALGSAALLTKLAYDKWYNSNYKFAEGLDVQVKKLDESKTKLEELNALRWEYNDLTYRLDQGGLSDEETQYANARLEEIKGTLKDKYKIDVDNSDIDAALAKAQQLAEQMSTKTENELVKSMEDLRPKYDKAVQELPKLRQQYAVASAAADKYRAVQGQIRDIEQSYNYHEIDQAEYIRQIAEAMDTVGAKSDFMQVLKYMDDQSIAASAAIGQLNGSIAKLRLGELETDIGNYENNIKQFEQAAEGLANINLDKFTNALKSGADGTKYLDRIAQYAKEGLIDADEYAKSVALISSGQEDLKKVFAEGGATVDDYVSNYIGNMTRFGASAEQTKAGLASLSKLFTDFGHELGTLPEKQHIEITADGKIEWKDTQPEVDEVETDGVVHYTDDYSGIGAPPEPPANVYYHSDFSAIPSKGPELQGTVTYTAVFNTVGVAASGALVGRKTGFKNAKGTDNFRGGLAMVNDQKGVADPRELIVDGGHAFIPDGRDVVLPLSKGAKIYTAAQTKAIMAGMGIPHYAGGKDNSESFTNVTDEWRHYTATHAVTATQEFEKWNDLLKSAAETTKDIWDAQEHVYSSQVKINKELDSASYDYIKNRNFNNDWGDYGDDPFAAFDRFSERQLGAAEASQQTWADAYANIHDFGEELFDGRVDQSLRWIEHEKKYNDLSLADEMALYRQIQEYARGYYEHGLIDQEKFREASTQIDEKYLDASTALYDKEAEEREKANQAILDRWEKDMTNWKRIHDTYDDWDEIGDSVSQMYGRAIVRQQEFFDSGVIDWQEYRDRTLDYQLEMYSAASSEYDAMLRKQADEIARLRDQFSKEETALRDSWAVADRRTDMSEVDRLLGIYENAATDAGQQRYKELLEQKKQLEREEQLYRLQQDNNAALDALQVDYDKMEADKKRVLASLKLYNADISHSVESTRDIAEQIGIDYANAADSTLDTLSDIYGLLQGISGLIRDRNSMYNYERRSYSATRARIAGGTVNYAANGGTLTYEQVESAINSAIVKGAGGF